VRGGGAGRWPPVSTMNSPWAAASRGGWVSGVNLKIAAFLVRHGRRRPRVRTGLLGARPSLSLQPRQPDSESGPQARTPPGWACAACKPSELQVEIDGEPEAQAEPEVPSPSPGAGGNRAGQAPLRAPPAQPGSLRPLSLRRAPQPAYYRTGTLIRRCLTSMSLERALKTSSCDAPGPSACPLPQANKTVTIALASELQGKQNNVT
jgi:hypothetical protein